jgi:hypothetical protein
MKNIIIFVFLPILILISLLVRSQEKVSVKIFPEIKHQKIESVGGNYCQTRLTNSAWDSIGEVTLKQFKPGYVRVAVPLSFRRIPYANYKGEKIVEQPLVISFFEALKRMKYEFGVKNFTVSTWNVPNELVVDSTKGNKRVIKPEAYDEILDMLVAIFLKAKNDYGVEVDYFSFNESDGGWSVLFSPQATIAFIKKAQERFKAVGLKTKFLLADTAQTKGTVEFATMIMADSTIWRSLGPVCFHSWWSENIPDSEFERIAGFAKAQNKPVWCTELGFDANAHRIKGMFESWDYGFRFAKISHRMLRYAEVEVSMYWTWQNDYRILSTDLKTMYPSYYITRQFVDYLNEGTQVIHSISSDKEILPIAGVHADGKQVLQLINVKKIPVTVNIEGYNSNSIDLVSTTEKNNWQVQKNIAKSKNSHTIINLFPESVNTIIIN